MTCPLGDEGWINTGVQPRRDGRVPERVGPIRERRGRLRGCERDDASTFPFAADPCTAAGYQRRCVGLWTPGQRRLARRVHRLGFNLLTGDYEFASLIIVHDETWWDEYAATSRRLGVRRPAPLPTLDHSAATALILDPAWSDEGLFALLQGLRRLTEIGGDRTGLPAVDWET